MHPNTASRPFASQAFGPLEPAEKRWLVQQLGQGSSTQFYFLLLSQEVASTPLVVFWILWKEHNLWTFENVKRNLLRVKNELQLSCWMLQFVVISLVLEVLVFAACCDFVLPFWRL